MAGNKKDATMGTIKYDNHISKDIGFLILNIERLTKDIIEESKGRKAMKMAEDLLVYVGEIKGLIKTGKIGGDTSV